MVGGLRMRRAIGIASAAFIAIVGAAVVAAPSAFAHSNSVTGWAQCSTDGTYEVTWTVVNDYQYSEDVTVDTLAPSGTTLAPSAAHLDPYGTGTSVQRGIPGSATSASLTVRGVWDTDGYTQTNFGSVDLSGDCLPSHTPAAPTSHEAHCTDGKPVSATITIPVDAGVVYTLDGSVESSGTYPVTPGSHTVVASSQTLDLTGETSFAFETASSPTCQTNVTPPEPVVTQAECVAGSPEPTVPTLTIEPTDGIVYSYAPASPYAAGQTVTLTATASSGHTFLAQPPKGWTRVDDTHETYTVTFDAQSCTATVTPIAPTVDQSECNDAGEPSAPSLTLASTTNITYSVDPKSPYTGGESVQVQATATGNGTFDEPAPDGWTYVDAHQETYRVVFDASPKCAAPQLPTIANSVCATDGSTTTPTLAFVTTAGVAYAAAHSAPFAAGESVTVTATATTGYEFSATAPPGWTYVDARHETTSVAFAAAPHCSQAAAPTFADATCTGTTPVGPTFTIPSATGVNYYVGGTLTAAGVHAAQSGSTLVVTAAAAPGYTLTGITSFTHTFAASRDCRTAVVAASTEFTDAVCADSQPEPGTYTIPSTVGVEYLVAAVVVPAGTYPAVAGATVVVTARADSGYVLSGVTMWTHTFSATATCAKAQRVAAPGFADPRCVNGRASAFTYTIPNIAGVDYFVDIVGGTPPAASGTPVPGGTYEAPALSTVTVTAGPQPGYRLTGKTTFRVTVPKSPRCGETVIPATAQFTDTFCPDSGAATSASYTIPNSEGVRYTVNGKPAGPGVHSVANGVSVTVLAHAESGYTLSGVTEWTHLFKGRAACSGTDSGSAHDPSGTSDGPPSIGTSGSGAGVTAYTGVAAQNLTIDSLALVLLGGLFVLFGSRRRRSRL